MAASHRLRLVVRGRVQGVGYRYFVLRKAEDYAVTGYVRNLPEMTLEVVAEGERTAVEAFIEVAAQGPSTAYITECKVFVEAPSGGFTTFGVKY